MSGPDDDDESGEEHELVVPVDPERGDFAYLLRRAERTLLSAHGSSARELLTTLRLRAAAMLDAIQWKKQTALEAGLIEWEQGETLHLAARTQLLASSKASREPRRYHGNSSGHVARRFLENTFMRQTAVGSYVITAYTPASQRFYLTRSDERRWRTTGQEVLDTATLTGREILNTFESALRALRTGLDDYKARPQVELFLETVQEGVSYEFAKSLSEIVAGGDSAIEITHQKLRQDDKPRRVEVAFDAVESSILNSVATMFAEDPEPQNVTLIGEVTLLSRSSDEPDRLIRLNVEEGADIRKARVRLTAEQYELAMQAHRQESGFKVSGRLERDGNLYWLYDARDVSLVPGDLSPRVVVTDERMSLTSGDTASLFEDGDEV